jgi:hypothetical protein
MTKQEFDLGLGEAKKRVDRLERVMYETDGIQPGTLFWVREIRDMLAIGILYKTNDRLLDALAMLDKEIECFSLIVESSLAQNSSA